jgi:pimeloyl-ACP methyl ester carboxylesterase
MIKLMAQLLDLHAIAEKNKHHSANSQYHIKNPKCPTADKALFYVLPQIPNIKFDCESNHEYYNVGHFQYKSEINDNLDSNCNVRGLYYENVQSKVHVIVVHGWRSTTWNHPKELLLNPLMEKNYNIYFIELPHHFTRNPTVASYPGEYFISANIDRSLLSVQQAVSDIQALIRYLQDKNEKIILIGISLGGLLVNLVSTLEKNIDGIISIFCADNLAKIVWNQPPFKFIKKDLMLNNCDYETLQSYWDIIQPSNYRPVVAKEKILLMSAKYDLFVDIKDSDLLWNSWDKPQRKLYNCGHSGMVVCKRTLTKDYLDFMEYVLK